ncbi:HIT family protein [Orrella daihaiensis]|uniref:HIT family protein n=2 Tax=Orrella daihaiensis TaxID=2782176 RepID=A0ABY4AUI4_9BURK|nr:HIT family protein [Orrella daihaiensis]
MCPLCIVPLPGELVRTENYVVIDAQDPTYPGLTRVVWLAHVAEMTDLPNPQRQALMQVVFTVEVTMREILHPDKVNLASLGNQVPHLHWHVIPRWRDDATFPGSIWSPANDTEPAQQRLVDIQRSLKDYHQALIQRLNQF